MKRINLTKLIITVFIISWIGVLPSLLIAYGVAIPPFLKFLEILMILGPLIGACIFIYRRNGEQGLKSLFRRLLLIKADLKTILVAVAFPPALVLLTSIISSKLSGFGWPDPILLLFLIPTAINGFLLYLLINTEELVWRGIVFDQLFDKYGFYKACLIIIPIWWVFHIPLFLFPEGHPAGYGLIEFTIIVISQSFILGWIYVRSKRSLFYVHIHHQLLNGLAQAFPIFPISNGGDRLPFWVFCSLMAAMAFVLAFRAKPAAPQLL